MNSSVTSILENLKASFLVFDQEIHGLGADSGHWWFKALENLECPDLFSLQTVLEEVIWARDYEVKQDDPVKKIVDIGSHVGVSVLWFIQNYPKAKIYAFEPDSRNYQCLLANLKTHIGTEVFPERAAVSSESGVANLEVVPNMSMASNIHNRFLGSSEHSESVRTVEIHSFLKERVDILKIDAEGSELDILKACPDLIKRNVRHLIVEVHEGPNLDPNLLPNILSLLSDLGFRHGVSLSLRHTLRNLVNASSFAGRKNSYLVRAANLAYLEGGK